ncbi:MAG: 16S rRNA (guanine(527)-N(7))-methyltransferase RsmG [Synechococcaceae cyanobacterium]
MEPGATPSPAAAGALPDQAFWARLGWQPSDQQLSQFMALQELLRHWNQRVNLTRLVEGDDYWIAQVFDSLWPLQSLLPIGALRAGEASAAEVGTGEVAAHGAGQNPGSLPGPSRGDSSCRLAPAQPHHGKAFHVIDVGTGGGFPGLAVAIALPEARLTLVDSVKRKLDAVAAMAAELGIADRLSLRCERVERTGRRPECRGRFQLALARAVAAAPVVAEYLVPLLAADGQALLYRGQWSEADGIALQAALRVLRAELGRMERMELPAGRGVRHALSLRPRQPCPAAYPRAVGIPSRQPLGQPTQPRLDR